MTGAQRIAKERDEQITKHGYTKEKDQAHLSFELVSAAEAIIATDHRLWPHFWNINVYHKIQMKPRAEQLQIAGAFLAAEIDRLLDSRLYG